MENYDWWRGVKIDVTVCDDQGIVLEINPHAIESYAKYGGSKLLGTNLLDCHPEPSKTKLKEMLEKGEENIYTTEKGGKKNLIAQLPWYKDGQFAGLVEFNIPLPAAHPQLKRD